MLCGTCAGGAVEWGLVFRGAAVEDNDLLWGRPGENRDWNLPVSVLSTLPSSRRFALGSRVGISFTKLARSCKRGRSCESSMLTRDCICRLSAWHCSLLFSGSWKSRWRKVTTRMCIAHLLIGWWYQAHIHRLIQHSTSILNFPLWMICPPCRLWL